MSSPHTLPLPLTAPPPSTHEHAWVTESRHRTSLGVVLYVRCAGCGIRRVDMQGHPHRPPAAVSRDVGTTSGG